MTMLDIISHQSITNLKVWCFTEALRTRDTDALKLWLSEWEKQDSKKK